MTGVEIGGLIVLAAQPVAGIIVTVHLTGNIAALQTAIDTQKMAIDALNAALASQENRVELMERVLQSVEPARNLERLRATAEVIEMNAQARIEAVERRAQDQHQSTVKQLGEVLTPADVHHGLAEQRVAARATVLATAYAAHSERFPRGLPRPPACPTQVWINPPKTLVRSPESSNTKPLVLARANVLA